MTRTQSFFARCAAVGLIAIAGGCGAAAPAEASRSERIERTRVALEVVLHPEAAPREAAHYVDLCDSEPQNLLYESTAWDPEGPELFESVDDANSSVVTGATGIPLARLACTAAGLDIISDLQNI